MLDEYRIDSILGAGGFGVTYKAWDSHLETWVAIKEYFPVEWSFRDGDGVTVHPNTQGSAVSGNEEQVSDYLWGLERFLDEARVLARIQHPFVVRVKRYFRAHGTAYIVMEYEEGEPLSAILQDGETLGEDEVRGLLEDVLPALQAVHEQGYLHRDIKPSNLYVRSSDHRVILIDFGAARAAVGRHSKSVTSLVTPGYSPPEQYTTRNDRYGGWTDLYALGAVLYRCVTGHAPTEAAERLLEDHQEPAVRACVGRYGTPLLQVIDRALAVRPEQRFQTVAEMQAALCEAGDEDDDETVILGPQVKPGGKPVRGFDAPRPTGPPSVPGVEWMPDRNYLEITQPSAASRQPVGQHLDALRSSPNDGAPRPRRPLGALVGGGLALAALLAVAVIWFWPSAPVEEEQSPPGYSLGQREQPPVTADASPPIPLAGPPVPAMAPPVAPVPDSMGSGTPPVVMEPVMPPPVSPAEPPVPPKDVPVAETVITGQPAVTEPAAPPLPAGDRVDVTPAPPPETRDLVEQPAPVQEPATGGPPETATAGGPAETEDGSTPEPFAGTGGVPGGTRQGSHRHPAFGPAHRPGRG
ncbi:MAG: protein kinase [Sphingobacterium sp.]|nr:protein kinase [Sphingobacterium sp.]